MTQAQATQFAVSYIKDDPQAALVDLSAPRVRFVVPSESLKETYERFPHMKPKRKHPDYWEVNFPYVGDDPFQRMFLTVIVYPKSGKAKLLAYF